GNKAYYRLFHVRFHKIGSRLLGVAADFPDHDHGIRLRIAIEQVERIDKVSANNRVAANADGRRLSDAAGRQLINRFVGERAGAGYDAHISLAVNVSGHDADFRFAWRDDAGTIGANQARAAVLQEFPGAHHVERGNAFSDANDQLHFGVGGFHNGVGRERRRHEDNCGVRARLIHRFLYAVEDGPAFVGGSALAWSHAADDFRSVLGTSLGMKRAFATSQALYDQPCIFINQDCHTLFTHK